MPFTYTYSRKTYPNGSYTSLSAKNADGKSLPKLVEDQFPGKVFKVKTSGSSVNFNFDIELTGSEETSLTSVVNGFTISSNPLKLIPHLNRIHRYEEMEYVSNNLVRKTYYVNKDGNGNFIDKVKEWTYQYQGSILLSMTMVEYNNDGGIYKSETYNYETQITGATTIIRKELQ